MVLAEVVPEMVVVFVFPDVGCVVHWPLSLLLSLVRFSLVALLTVQTSHHTKNTYSPSSSLKECHSCRAHIKAESKQISYYS